MSADADGAVHITAAAKAAAAAPTVAINTLVFMLGFLFSGRRRHSAAACPYTHGQIHRAIVVRYDLMDNSYKSAGEHEPVGAELSAALGMVELPWPALPSQPVQQIRRGVRTEIR